MLTSVGIFYIYNNILGKSRGKVGEVLELNLLKNRGIFSNYIFIFIKVLLKFDLGDQIKSTNFTPDEYWCRIITEGRNKWLMLQSIHIRVKL